MNRSAFSVLSAWALTLGGTAEAAPQLFASQNNRRTSTSLDLIVQPGS